MKIRYASCAAVLASLAGTAIAQPTVDGELSSADRAFYGNTPLWSQNLPTMFGDSNVGDQIVGGTGDPENVTTGIEIALPKSALGSATSFRLAGWVTSGDRQFMSNQTIHDGSFPLDTANLGTDVNFATDARTPNNMYTSVSSIPSGTPTVDGSLDGGVYTTRYFLQTNFTGFGDNADATDQGGGGSEIDAVYIAQDASNYYIFIAGNIESNGNGLDLYFDTDNGATGENDLSATASSGSGGFIPGNADTVFDAGFAANYLVSVDAFDDDASGGTPNVPRVHAGTVGGNIRVAGNLAGYGASNAGALTGAESGAPAMSLGVNNSNVAGVLGSASTSTPVAPDIDWAYGSELDNLYSYQDSTDLYLFIGGNLEVNYNKLVLFIDADSSDGQNVLRTDNVDLQFNRLNNELGGVAFDTGFAPDYVLFYNIGVDGGTGNVVNYADATTLRASGALFDAFSGVVIDYAGSVGGDRDGLRNIPFDGPRVDIQDGSFAFLFTEFAPRTTTDDPQNPVAGLLEVSYNASNTGGVTDAAATGAASVTFGTEIRIDLDELGWDGSSQICVAGFVSNSDLNFLSNQVIGGMPTGTENLGDPTPFDSEGMPLPALDFTTIDGDQFVCLMNQDGPQPCNRADLAQPYQVLNFADVQSFLGAFGQGLPAADLAAPMGVFNFADVQTFLGLFGQGC